MNENTPQTIYGAYARKSSEQEDRQVASIPSQKREFNEYSKREKLSLKLILEESHSAKRPGRPVFSEMLKLIEKGEINGLLVWSCNRISRNAIDTGFIIDLMDRGKLLEVRTATQAFRNTPNDKFLLNLFCSQAKLENDNKGVDVKRGLREKAEAGIYPAPALLGYLNDKYAERGNKTILPDPDRFDVCRKMVDMMLTGKYTPPQIWRIARDEWEFCGPKGKLISRSSVYRLFTHPFYYGEFEYPQGSGNWYQGIHKPLMTRTEFDRIQELLGRKSPTRPKRHHHTFAYRGPLRCGECRALITAEEKIKRQQNGNVHRYIYYHCTKRVDPTCSQGAIREKDLKKQIAQALSEIEIPSEFREWALEELRGANEQEAKARKAIYRTQRREYEACIRKIDKLIDMRADEEITEEEFTRKKRVLLRKKKHHQELLKDIDQRLENWLETAERCFNFAEKAQTSFEKGGLEKKKEIFTALGSNLVLKNKKLFIDWDNLLVPMKSAAKEVRAIHERLEPHKNVVTKAEMGQIYAQNPTVLRALDEVRTIAMGYKGSLYHLDL